MSAMHAISSTTRTAIDQPVPLDFVPIGYRYRVCPEHLRSTRPWEGAGIVAEWAMTLPGHSDTIDYQTLYVRVDKAAQMRNPAQVMASAHSLCPSDLPYSSRMRWMAQYFLANIVPVAQA